MGDAGYPERPVDPESRPEAEPPDRELVALAKRGDRTAFGRMFARRWHETVARASR